MKEMPEMENYLCQHLISSIPVRNLSHVLSNNSNMDLELADNSPFIPLSVFLHCLKQEEGPIDIPFIEKASKNLVCKTFQINFE